MTNTPKPVLSIRHGNIQSAIWQNENEQGVYYTTTFERAFKNAEGKWQNTSSFGRDDLLLLAKIADEAHTAICQMQDRDREERTRTRPAPAAAVASTNGKAGKVR